MGGNAFPHLQMVRVQRADVLPTVQFVTNTLALPNFDYEYARNNLMGSAGKQSDSGDLDFAVNNRHARFVGQNDLPVFDLRSFAARCREVLPENHVNLKTLKGGQFQSTWPVAGDPTKGFVQVDFIEGDPEWLKFSHWSPGKDVSPWKGVMISTMLGVLAKFRRDFLLNADGSYSLGPSSYESSSPRVARVGLHFDLELGLHRKWELRLRPGQGMSKVDPDYFETHVAKHYKFMAKETRYSRLGYVTEPEAVLTMLFGRPTVQTDVDTFEKMVQHIRECHPGRFYRIKSRFLEAFTRSAGTNDYDLTDVKNDPVWDV